MEVVIRNVDPSEYSEVECMTREAFWNLYVPGCDEHYLVHTVRNHKDYLPDLEFVAVKDGTIVGSILYTKSFLLDEDDRKVETLSFGPLCVRPGFQRKGIGAKLIEHTRRLAADRGCPGIFIYGDPHNYCKNGFKNGKDFQVSDPDGRYPYGLLALILDPDVFRRGHAYRLHQSDAFHLDSAKAEEFDRRFPEKKKEYQYTQELFSISRRAYLI
ncbi:MAG: N-acetyltransferase [Anaerolineales bacterium]|nr:N-acetyltransferase [Anaerolineales bacterium]